MTFEIAYSGDFLDEAGAVAYWDIGLDRLDAEPGVRHHFLSDQAPQPGDVDRQYVDRDVESYSPSLRPNLPHRSSSLDTRLPAREVVHSGSRRAHSVVRSFR